MKALPHLLAALVVAMLVGRVPAAPIPDLFPTGVNNAGTLLPAGATDPHYTLIAGGGPEAFVVNEGFPIGPWMSNGPTSKWIAPQADQSSGNAAGNYTYQISFDLDGLRPETAVITGQWSCDNAGTAIALNGTPTGDTHSGNFGAFESFIINSGFVNGVNTLDFTVNNAGNSANPTGIRVEISGTAEIEAPPGTPPTILSSPTGATVNIGGSATFQVVASGASPLTYQWFKDGGSIAGAASPTYNIPVVSSNDAGIYNVVATNPWGTAASGSAQLQISLDLATDEQREREPLGPSRRRSGLAFSEIHYHPLGNDPDALEFVEIYNSNPWPEPLAGYRLEGDIEFTFPAGTEIAAEGFVVVAADPGIYAGAIGPWGGSLPDSGGSLRLIKRSGAVILEVSYDDQFPWPVAADGAGHSLILARPSYGEDDPRAWGQSASISGSPSAHEAPVNSTLEHIFINEILANDATDFIELYNRSFAEIDISGCIITDDPATDRFIVPPDTTIPAGGFLVFNETQLGFGFAAAGETALLRNPAGTRVIDAVRFGAQQQFVSFGRSPDGNPNSLSPLASQTPGASNAPPQKHPITINEIMFNPLHEDGSEYIEIVNTHTSPLGIGGYAFTDGIDFSFPDGTSIPAGGFLVVAKDREQLLADHPSLSPAIVFGDYGGSLSDRGERVALSQPIALTGNTVALAEIDSVTYSDGGRWGRLADGGGSSLELTDPDSDNRHASNWANSDESNKAPWSVIEHTGVLELGKGTADQLQMFLLDAGEALIDDVEVVPDGSSNRVTNPGFSNASNWFFQGTHELSSIGGGALHLRATRRGDIGANRIRTPLSSALTNGQQATIRARARWLGGSPYLLFRLLGNYLEVPAVLDVPRDLGTPGAPNSALQNNAPPAITDLRHAPVLPAANEAVRVTARATDPDGLASLTLTYRIDPSASTTALTMRDDGTAGDLVAGDGVFSAVVPGQSSGALAAFAVTATDNPGAGAQVPTGEALVRWGDGDYPGDFANYRIWMTEATVNEWAAREKMSNRPLGVTFVYNDSRVVYDAGGHYSGSAYTSPGYDSPTGRVCGYDLTFPRDEMVMGDNRLTLDFPVRDPTAQREQLMYWFCDQFGLPNNYRRYVNLFVNGRGQRQRGGWGGNSNATYTDIQQPNSDSVREWFPGETGGSLIKGSYWHEFDNAGARINPATTPTLELFNSAAGGKSLARYRWNWRPRAVSGSPNDLSQIFKLADAMNAPGDALIPALHANVDIDQWMRTLVVNDCAANWDSFGNPGGKNSFHYRPPDGRWQIMSWDFDVGLGVFNNPIDAALFSVSDPTFNRLYSTPELMRHYWHAMREAVDTFFQSSAVAPVLDSKWAALQAAGVPVTSPNVASGQEGLSIPNWIDQRRSFMLEQLAAVEAPFEITTNGGANFATATAPVELEGTAPMSVHALTLDGVAVPFEWTGLNTWRIETALAPGTLALAIGGVDRDGAAIAGATDTIIVTTSSGDDSPISNLVINEIMYDPTMPGGEFLELHNRSTTTAFDLGGWRVNGLGLTFPAGMVIEPGEFLVLGENRSTFGMIYGWGIPVATTFPGSLDNSGEAITLLMPDDTEIDRVRYSPSPPWPPTVDASLQLADPSRDNARAANWFAPEADAGPPETLVSMTANWRYNQNGFAPADWNQPSFDDSNWPAGDALLYVESSPLPAPKNTLLGLGPTTFYFRHTFDHTGSPGGSLALSTIFDDGAIVYLNGEEIFRIRLQDGPINANTFASPSVSNAVLEGPFVVTAPSLVTGQNVVAVEVHQTVANSSDIVMGIEVAEADALGIGATPGAPNIVPGGTAPEPAPLWLNEIRPVNAGGITDNAGDADPWLELFNAGAAPVSLAGWFLSDDPAQLDKWALSATASIGPGEFDLVWLDAEPGEGDDHASFTPAPAIGIILLAHQAPGASAPVLIDALTYSDLPAERSFGRFPDASPEAAQAFATPTPGAANDNSVPVPAVTINEWMASNNGILPDPSDGDFDDWFELYNAGPNAVDLTGFTLTDDLSDPARFTIPAGISIAAGGFLLVWADDETAQNVPGGDLHVNFQLGAGGDSIALFTPDGTLVDSVSFGAQSDDQSEGRWPDGATGGGFFSQSAPTPGGVNDLTPAGPIQLPSPGLLDAGDGLSLEFDTEFGRYYLVQNSGDLTTASWQDFTQVIAGTGGVIGVDLPAPDGARMFYRIAIIENP